MPGGSTQSRTSFSSAATHLWTLRRRSCWVRSPNQRSTWLSHDEPVGVKCTWNRRWPGVVLHSDLLAHPNWRPGSSRGTVRPSLRSHVRRPRESHTRFPRGLQDLTTGLLDPELKVGPRDHPSGDRTSGPVRCAMGTAGTAATHPETTRPPLEMDSTPSVRRDPLADPRRLPVAWHPTAVRVLAGDLRTVRPLDPRRDLGTCAAATPGDRRRGRTDRLAGW